MSERAVGWDGMIWGYMGDVKSLFLITTMT